MGAPSPPRNLGKPSHEGVPGKTTSFPWINPIKLMRLKNEGMLQLVGQRSKCKHNTRQAVDLLVFLRCCVEQ